jgi:hypothetical protein
LASSPWRESLPESRHQSNLNRGSNSLRGRHQFLKFFIEELSAILSGRDLWRAKRGSHPTAIRLLAQGKARAQLDLSFNTFSSWLTALTNEFHITNFAKEAEIFLLFVPCQRPSHCFKRPRLI